MTENVIIMGAAGRDFHNYLTYFKGNPRYRVVCFTAEQIPGIADRGFPAALAGTDYPDGIPIHPEEELPALIARHQVDHVCLAYSDLSHQDVMVKASRALAAGASFMLLGQEEIYVPADRPVIAICAVRTGCGKSQTSRAIAAILREHGKKVVAIRHSMPYGDDLTLQTCQRFASVQDFETHDTTIEEEEEYQPWVDHGFVVYAGFDYREIVAAAQQEADVLIFDGGNNDLPMVKPDLLVTVADPHRPGHELGYYPGMVNFLMADVVLVNKVGTAPPEGLEAVRRSIRQYNPGAEVVEARSELVVGEPEMIQGKLCAVIGDGPTLSHGGMPFGAGTLAVQKYGGRLADPRQALVGSIAATYEKYPHLAEEIPAMGYSDAQIRDLEQTVNGVQCDVVVDGSPANLQRLMQLTRPVVKVGYELGLDSRESLQRILRERGLI